jgi:hypothetical protein
MSLILQGSTSGSVTLQEPSVAGTTVLTLPATSGNVVVDSATQTLTNKTIQGGTITSGTAVASTSGTSIDFTSIPSWVKRITVMFDGVSTNGTSSIQIQLGDSGGIETSGYLGALLRTGTTTLLTVQYPTTGFLIVNDVNAADAHSGIAVISLLGSNNWCNASQVSETASPVFLSGSGNKALSDVIDRVRVTTVNGTDTFDAGTINILYEG